MVAQLCVHTKKGVECGHWKWGNFEACKLYVNKAVTSTDCKAQPRSARSESRCKARSLPFAQTPQQDWQQLRPGAQCAQKG